MLVQWYVVSAVVAVCLLCVVAATTVCLYRWYRRRRYSSSAALPPILDSSSSVPDVDSPLDAQGMVGALKHGSGVGTVQQSRGQPARKPADQHGDVFHGPTCTVSGDHGVVCQVNVRTLYYSHINNKLYKVARKCLCMTTQIRTQTHVY